MKALVTGGAGFIGSHLVDRLLVEGEEVLTIDDLSSGSLGNLADARRTRTDRFTFQRLDIRSSAVGDVVKRFSPDIVFHLAAQVDVRRSVADPVSDAMVNVVGTLNLLQAASDAGTRKFVFTSSGGCIYGEPEPASLPVEEAKAFSPEALPESPYGVSKKIALDYLRYFREVKGLDFTALALANVFGPRQEPASEVGLEGQVVAIFCRRLLAGQPCTIYGDGTQTRDFVYVDDVVAAYLAARDRGSGELINVGTGIEVSVNQLYAELAQLIGSTAEPTYAPGRTGELYRIAVDPAKAATELGWSPVTSLSEGLKQTAAWFRAS